MGGGGCVWLGGEEEGGVEDSPPWMSSRIRWILAHAAVVAPVVTAV
jgi:hypothetical protein